ncbi:MAG TPA: ABC transporter ATP-binding protein [Caulobacterales bacterium]|jgi:ABC-type multidrug transport system fused ATPase/permease subunit|nr:ABC transporter ATP-binding protein [Caulobacterales bacterium]
MTALHHQSVLLSYLRPEKKRAAMLVALLVCGIGMQLISPLIIRQFIDAAARGGGGVSLNFLWLLAGGFIAAAIGTQLVQVGVAYYAEQIAWAATNLMRRDLAAHCLHLDMAFHTARTPGELIERVDGDVVAISTIFSQFVTQVIGGGLLLIGILAVLYAQDVRVGLALTVFAGVTILSLHLVRDLARDEFEAERQAWSELSGFLEERIGGLDDIRANGGGSYVLKRLGVFADALIARGVVAQRRGVLMYVMLGAIFTCGFAASLSLGVYLFQQGVITIGAVIMFAQYTTMMNDPLVRIGQQLPQFQAAIAGLSRVGDLRAIQPLVKDGPGLGWQDAKTRAPDVAFEDVRFAYNDRETVIDGVSFDVPAGAVLGLLGRTGSGKTTLTRLLFRLYDIRGGRILLDGEPISRATLNELRGRIGLVTQDVQMFEASVRDNATLFDQSIPDARVADVLTDLGLGPWLSRQKEGLDTILVGAGGLSAGEAQLLAFARVFLKDPGLVVLDEATSRLDPTTDRLIERAMDKLLRAREGGAPRTAIIIAHKLETVRRADKIVILDRGRVLEAGARAALAADPGSRFAGLLRHGIEEVLT